MNSFYFSLGGDSYSSNMIPISHLLDNIKACPILKSNMIIFVFLFIQV